MPTKPTRTFPLILVLALLGWAGLAQQPFVPAIATLPELQARLSNHVAEQRFEAAIWGAKVVSLDSGKTLFEHNAQKLFSPASNSKLYTIALALDRLGGDYRIRTSLYAKSRPNRRGTLDGDLVVYGRGDPSINARLHSNDIYQALAPLVTALTNAGVRRISGDLVADESYFRGPPYGSGWACDDLESYYGAEISALTINDNALRLSVKPGERPGAPCQLSLSPATTYLSLSNRTETVDKGGRRSIRTYRPLNENVVYVAGSLPVDDKGYTDGVTMHNPAGLFLAFFKEALDRQGIKVGGRLRTVNWLDDPTAPPDRSGMIELGAMESLTMRELAREVLKPSQNLYTDLLLAHVGERTRAASGRTNDFSEELGTRDLDQFLVEAGVPRDNVFFEEGSGLSRNNLTTPNATIALLRFMSRHREAAAYLDGLPVAGQDGTLRNRMKGTPAAGNVRAKTGTLRWANSLSGHVTTAAGEHLVFSLMLNRYQSPDPAHSGRAELDAIAITLAGFTGRSAD